MEAYRFETTILENGTIQIPNFQKLKSQKVEVLVLFKNDNSKIIKEKEAEEFVNKWFGYFPLVDTDDVKYNAIMDKQKY